jgi:Tetracyclin repressor-like, C-terminal domain
MTGILTAGAYSGVFTVALPGETARALLGMLQAITRWYKTGGSLNPERLAQRYIVLALALAGEPPDKRARQVRPRRRLAAAWIQWHAPQVSAEDRIAGFSCIQ